MKMEYVPEFAPPDVRAQELRETLRKLLEARGKTMPVTPEEHAEWRRTAPREEIRLGVAATLEECMRPRLWPGDDVWPPVYVKFPDAPAPPEAKGRPFKVVMFPWHGTLFWHRMEVTIYDAVRTASWDMPTSVLDMWSFVNMSEYDISLCKLNSTPCKGWADMP